MKGFIITGTSQGLGAALLEKLDQNSNTIISIGRSNPPKISKANVYHHETDFSKPDFKTLDLHILDDAKELTVIMNAGTVNPLGHFEKKSFEEWKEGFSINFLAHAELSHLIISHFAKKRIQKKMLFLSSGAALHPYEGWSAYCTSKAAMRIFALCLREEQLATDLGFQITNLYPGYIDSQMQEILRTSDQHLFPKKEKFERLSKENKLLPASEVADHLLKLLKSPNLPEELSLNDR